jgi:hypothetical protein
MSDDYVTVFDDVSGREVRIDNWFYDEWASTNELSQDMISSSNLEAIRNRASIQEVIDFANKVRKAGGGNIIDDLIPSEPESSNSCLIANALNFHSEIEADSNGVWQMTIHDIETGKAISEEVGLDIIIDEEYNLAIIDLPENIGFVAKAFDSYQDAELEKYNEAKLATV